jgi:GTP-binding protein Era
MVMSAKTKFNVSSLVPLVLPYLPVGPPLFPKDQYSDRPERFFLAEAIREKIFTQYQKEIPYGCEVVIQALHTQPNGVVHVDANIHVERDSQKAILIGRKGEALKVIGTYARRDMEVLLDAKVMLKLQVVVTPDWRKKEHRLKTLGYDGNELS